jgi:DNA-binding NtrC family response regulator
MRKHSKQAHKKINAISEEAMGLLNIYNWPGNVRELENVIERAVILCKDTEIKPADFPDFLRKPTKAQENLVENHTGGNGRKLKEALKEPEKDLLVQALESVNWNRNETAKALGINRTTLYKKMLRYGLLKFNGNKK